MTEGRVLEGDRVEAQVGPVTARELGVRDGSWVRGTVVGFSSSLTMTPKVRTRSGKLFYADESRLRRSLAGT